MVVGLFGQTTGPGVQAPSLLIAAVLVVRGVPGSPCPPKMEMWISVVPQQLDVSTLGEHHVDTAPFQIT